MGNFGWWDRPLSRVPHECLISRPSLIPRRVKRFAASVVLKETSTIEESGAQAYQEDNPLDLPALFYFCVYPPFVRPRHASYRSLVDASRKTKNVSSSKRGEECISLAGLIWSFLDEAEFGIAESLATIRYQTQRRGY